ncbi:lysosomal protective protein-like isoform X2 [Ptychodera flava]
MMKSIVFVISLCNIWLALGVQSLKNTDEITYLPGLQKQPSFKHYSGYLKATGTKMLHYWFVESQNKPTADPVILWLNGGPGCSSLDGLLSEHGPYIIQPDGVNLQYNEYSWNMKASVIYLESPAGVGFSYSDDGNYTTDDDQVAEDNYQALKSFFALYPDFAKLPFFILGESYGGIYVPTLAVKVMADTAIKFQGFAVGNGVTSFEDLSNSIVYFSYYHGLFGTSLWSSLQQNCCTNNGTKCNFYNNTDIDCMSGIQQVDYIISGIGLNVYNLYADCAGGVPGNSVQKDYFRYTVGLDHIFSEYDFKKKEKEMLKYIPKHRLKLVPPCINATAVTTYLNDPYVKQALHIKDGLPGWEICNGDVTTTYKRLYDSMQAQYLALLATYNYRILVYNGDVDMACNFLGDQWFVEKLNLEEQIQRRPWLYNDGTDQVAGFVKEFENLAFATVKGAGHLAPQEKRKAMQQLITNFIEKKPY